MTGAAVGGRSTPLRTIVVPLDGSSFSSMALPPAQVLAARLGAELVLVQAAAPAPIPGIEPALARQLGETDARASLVRAAARARAQGLLVRELLVVGSRTTSPAQAILAAAQETGAGLIVMATHGRTGLQRAVLGSVADAVVAQATAPVLLVRPRFGPAGGGVASAVIARATIPVLVVRATAP